MAAQVDQANQPAHAGGEQAPADPLVTLQGNDGQVFNIPTSVARVSITVRTMLEDLGGMDDGEGAADDNLVPLPNVRGEILQRVITWATHHKDDPPIEEDDDRNEKRTDDISQWDQDFLREVQQPILFDLILAANYLDIKGLLDVTCKTVANMIKGKTPDEIRATFNIQNDFTQAEEEQIRKENEWCEEK